MNADSKTTKAGVETLAMLTCKVCGHEWFRRSAKLPKQCPNPKCGSEHWQTGRRRQPRQEQLAKAAAIKLETSKTTLANAGFTILEAEVVQGGIVVPVLAQPPCGPWKEAIEQAKTYYITGEQVTDLGYLDGDFFVRADGDSMLQAGIPDGALLLMRPINGTQPKHGTIALVQVFTRDEHCLGTIKRWYTVRGKVDLRDGAGKPFRLPLNTERIEGVAVMIGIIAGRTK